MTWDGTAMTFERPELLPWLPVALVLVAAALVWHWRRTVRLRDAYGGEAPARRLTGRTLGRFPGGRLLSVFLAATALVLAASGVRRDTGEPPPPPTPLDVVIALDVSHSMTAADVEPSRMERARAAAQAIVDQRVADRVALTTFAGWPYPLVPMTDDLVVAEYFLPWVRPELVESRQQGTALAAAIGDAGRTVRTRERGDAIPVLVILSDGEAHGAAPAVLDSARVLADAGVRIWTGGVGTEEGGALLVSRSSGAPLLGGTGAQVVAGYDADLLRDIARIGGGAFHDIGSDGGLRDLTAELQALRGARSATRAEAFDPTGLLVLVGLVLLLLDAALDVGIRRGRNHVA